MSDPVPKPKVPGRVWMLVFATVPILGIAYQYAAEQTGAALAGQPLNLHWFVRAAAEPWARGLLALEVASFVAWMYVLARAELSAAFPLTAVSYLLVIGLGWIGFHEPVTAPQIVGALAIIAGVWLLRPHSETPSPTDT